MKYRFGIGDRVRVIASDDGDTRVGAIGTVLELSTAPWVRLDEPTRYPHGCYVDGAREGYMDCFAESDIELVSSPIVPEATAPEATPIAALTCAMDMTLWRDACTAAMSCGLSPADAARAADQAHAEYMRRFNAGLDDYKNAEKKAAS